MDVTPITSIPKAVEAMSLEREMDRLKQAGRRIRLGLRAEVEHAQKEVAKGAPLHRVVRSLFWQGLPFDRAMQLFVGRV